MVLELRRIYPIRGGGGSGPGAEPLSICGVLLGRGAGAGAGRQRKNIDKAECETFGAALGYAAHAVDVIASYLDMPLRYSLRVFASRSIIVDLAPPLRLANPPESSGEAPGRGDAGARYSFSYDRSDGAGAGGVPLFPQNDGRGRRPSAAAPARRGPSQPRPVVYPNVALPLYLEGVHQTNEFLAAVWLLNKNIEQLLSACGEASCGYGAPRPAPPPRVGPAPRAADHAARPVRPPAPQLEAPPYPGEPQPSLRGVREVDHEPGHDAAGPAGVPGAPVARAIGRRGGPRGVAAGDRRPGGDGRVDGRGAGRVDER